MIVLLGRLPAVTDNAGLTTNSGRKIIAILEKNPKKDPNKYEEDDIAHMRKVVSYCKRHMAQEAKGPAKNPESKSYKSLKVSALNSRWIKS